MYIQEEIVKFSFNLEYLEYIVSHGTYKYVTNI